MNVENRHTPLASSDSTDLLSISEAAFFKKRAILLHCPIALFEQFLTNVKTPFARSFYSSSDWFIGLSKSNRISKCPTLRTLLESPETVN